MREGTKAATIAGKSGIASDSLQIRAIEAYLHARVGSLEHADWALLGNRRLFHVGEFGRAWRVEVGSKGLGVS